MKRAINLTHMIEFDILPATSFMLRASHEHPDEVRMREVPEELVKRYEAAVAEWRQVQKQLDALFEQKEG